MYAGKGFDGVAGQCWLQSFRHVSCIRLHAHNRVVVCAWASSLGVPVPKLTERQEMQAMLVEVRQRCLAE